MSTPQTPGSAPYPGAPAGPAVSPHPTAPPAGYRYVAPGYVAPGYVAPGYVAPGYPAPGVGQPAQAPSGYAPSGYAPSGHAPSGYAPSAYVPPGRPGGAYGPPVGPDARPTKLASIALGLSSMGVLLAFFPLVTWFSGLPLLAGFIVGLTALVRMTQGGTGRSVTALILAVVGWMVSLVMSIWSFALVNPAMWGQPAPGEAWSYDDGSSGTYHGGIVGDPVADREELLLADVAYGPSSFGSNAWWYVVIIDNPNEDVMWDRAEIAIHAQDAEGTTLETSYRYRTLLAGRSAVTGLFVSTGDAEIADVSVTLPNDRRAFAVVPGTQLTFHAEVLETTLGYDGTSVSGEVWHDFADEQRLIEVVVVGRDADGAIIDTDLTFLGKVPEGTTTPFDALLPTRIPADGSVEVYASR